MLCGNDRGKQYEELQTKKWSDKRQFNLQKEEGQMFQKGPSLILWTAKIRDVFSGLARVCSCNLTIDRCALIQSSQKN